MPIACAPPHGARLSRRRSGSERTMPVPRGSSAACGEGAGALGRLVALPVLVPVLALSSACGTGYTPRLRYTGQLTGCGPTVPATLTRSGDRFSFTPGDGSLIIAGEVDARNDFSGALDTGRAAGGGAPSGGTGKASTHYVLSLRGHIDRDVAQATYTTPRCQSHLRLTRAEDPPL